MGGPETIPESERASEVLAAEMRRREVTARTLSLIVGLLGIPGTFEAARDATGSGIWIILAFFSTLFVVGYGLGFTRYRVHVAKLLIGGMLVEHVLSTLRTPLEIYTPTPFFTPIVVFIAAVTLGKRGVLVSSFGEFCALGVMTWWRFGRVGSFQAEVEATVPFLLAVTMSAVAIVQSRGAERTLGLQIEREDELWRARAEAKANFDRYQLISRNTEDLVLVLDHEGKITFASASHERVLGKKPEELLGLRMDVLIHPDDRVRLRHSSEEPHEGRVQHEEVRLLLGEGRVRWFALAAKELLLGDESGVVLSLRDVTETRRLAQALEESRRLESLGRLAGAVAHDFNNLLTIVGGGAEHALASLAERETVRGELELILDSVERSAGLTKQLLLFGRKLAQPLSVVDMAAVLRGMHPLLQRSMPAAIELSLRVPSAPLVILGDSTQVEQIVMNLVVNARDAMPDGGRLEVSLTRTSGREGSKEACALLSVSDSGVGMSEEVKGRIFEPYFTTKAEGKGTGLGLSTVYGIVSRWGGAVEIESELGKGTTFLVRVPLHVSALPN